MAGCNGTIHNHTPRDYKNTCNYGSPLGKDEECIDTYLGCYHRKKRKESDPSDFVPGG